MKQFTSALNVTTWYLNYIGIPLTVGVAVYILLKKIRLRKWRVALQGKVVVITGASSGIGEALAHAFYDQGCKVVLAARRGNELERVKHNLQSKNVSIPTQEPVILILDLADLNTIEDFVQKVYEQCGSIDILINNGGVSHRGSVLHSKMEVFKQLMFINYFGSVALTKAALPKMVEKKCGHIVFVSSVQGLIATPDRAAYTASKHAIQAFGDSLRAEMKQHNINVTVVSPGYVQTAVSINALNESGGKNSVMEYNTATGFTSEYLAERMLNSIVNKENELRVSQFLPNFAIFLRRFAPSFFFWAMAKRAVETKL